MKLKYLAIAALGLGLAFTSCESGSKGSDKPLSDYSNLSEIDSLSYYLGEMYAGQFFQLAQKDSTLNKEDFMKGLADGMAMINDNEAYNKGVMMGIQFAMQSSNFKEETGEEVNKNMLLNGLAYGLSGDSIKNASEMQTKFQDISARLAQRAQDKANAEAKKVVEAAAKKKGYKSDGKLFVKVTTPGEGENLQTGYEFSYTMKAIGPDGKPIEQLSQPGEQKGILGRTIPLQTSIGEAMLTMKPGETASFLFAADQFLNGNASAINLKKTDVITVTLSIGKEVTKAKEEPAKMPDAPVKVTPAPAK